MNPVQLLQELLDGKTITLGEQKLKLFKKGQSVPLPGGEQGEVEQTFWLGQEMSQDGLPVYCGCDIPFTAFLNQASKQ